MDFYVNVLYELYFSFAQKDSLYNAFGSFLLCKVFRADSPVRFVFNLHAKSVNGGFVNWSEKFTGLKCFREIYIGHCSLSSK